MRMRRGSGWFDLTPVGCNLPQLFSRIATTVTTSYYLSTIPTVEAGTQDRNSPGVGCLIGRGVASCGRSRGDTVEMRMLVLEVSGRRKHH